MISAQALVDKRQSESWHKDKTLGRPVPGASYNETSADGQTITEGTTVWCADRKGRIIRGTARYNINNMWWVICDRWTLTNQGCRQVYCRPPHDLRKKRNGRGRRRRLEELLAEAIRAMDFRRAETLRKVTFGDQQLFTIWSKKHDAYYRSCYSGYTSDVISAGKYLQEEAEREVARTGSILRAISLTGATSRKAEELA